MPAEEDDRRNMEKEDTINARERTAVQDLLKDDIRRNLNGSCRFSCRTCLKYKARTV